MGADPRAARRARPPSSPRAARAALLLAAAAAATVLLLRALRRPTPEPWTPCAPGAARAAPACAGPRQPWPLALFDHESHVHSQGDQDGVLAEIFSRLGTTNRFFAEFGFDADSFAGGVGANTQLLYAQGWRGLLMDGGHENAAIGLHREMITPGNVVGLFAKYGVPLEPDYVSIDLDSTDLWVFLALTKVYRPRVMSIEYNMNFPAGRWAAGCALAPARPAAPWPRRARPPPAPRAARPPPPPPRPRRPLPLPAPLDLTPPRPFHPTLNPPPRPLGPAPPPQHADHAARRRALAAGPPDGRLPGGDLRGG
jgi:hypothetical protein